MAANISTLLYDKKKKKYNIISDNIHDIKNDITTIYSRLLSDTKVSKNRFETMDTLSGISAFILFTNIFMLIIYILVMELKPFIVISLFITPLLLLVILYTIFTNYFYNIAELLCKLLLDSICNENCMTSIENLSNKKIRLIQKIASKTNNITIVQNHIIFDIGEILNTSNNIYHSYYDFIINKLFMNHNITYNICDFNEDDNINNKKISENMNDYNTDIKRVFKIIFNELDQLEYDTEELEDILKLIKKDLKDESLKDNIICYTILNRYLPLLYDSIKGYNELKENGIEISEEDSDDFVKMLNDSIIIFNKLHNDIYNDYNHTCFSNSRVLSQIYKMDGLL